MRVGINVWRPVEHALSGAARVAWPVLQSLNQTFSGQDVSTGVGAGSASEELGTNEASPRLAAQRPTRSARNASKSLASASCRASKRSTRWSTITRARLPRTSSNATARS